MAGLITNRGMYLVLSGGVDLNADTIKVMLLASTFTPLATHNVIDDIGASEISGTGYASGFGGSGRKILTSKAFAEDDMGGLATFDADDLTWSGLNAGTPGFAAIVKEGTSDTDSPVIGYVAFTPRATTGSNFKITWNASGILQLTS